MLYQNVKITLFQILVMDTKINFFASIILMIAFTLISLNTYGNKYEIDGLWELESEEVGTEDLTFKYVYIYRYQINNFLVHDYGATFVMFNDLNKFLTTGGQVGYTLQFNSAKDSVQIAKFEYKVYRKRFNSYYFRFAQSLDGKLHLKFIPGDGFSDRSKYINSRAVYQKKLQSHKDLINVLTESGMSKRYNYGPIIYYSGALLAYEKGEYELAHNYLSTYLEYVNSWLAKDNMIFRETVKNYLENYTNVIKLERKISLILENLKSQNKYFILPLQRSGKDWPIRFKSELFLICNENKTVRYEIATDKNKEIFFCQDKTFKSEEELIHFMNDISSYN